MDLNQNSLFLAFQSGVCEFSSAADSGAGSSPAITSEGARERGSEGARERGSERARERESERVRERESEGVRERESERDQGESL